MHAVLQTLFQCNLARGIGFWAGRDGALVFQYRPAKVRKTIFCRFIQGPPLGIAIDAGG